jgi:hypothetical protein
MNADGGGQANQGPEDPGALRGGIVINDCQGALVLVSPKRFERQGVKIF